MQENPNPGRVGPEQTAGIGPGPARRALDVTVAGLALLLLFPLLALVAVAIRLTSPGPAIFKQERVGQGGRTFAIYKFRSMIQRPTGSMLTAPGDGRVTVLGRFLRATCIDELPQLINILVGHMTLVGPRPQTVALAGRYPSEIAHVFQYRPGLTGPGVLYLNDEDVLPGAAHDLEEFYLRNIVPQRAALDLEYVANADLRQTILYLAHTAFVPLRVFRTTHAAAPITLTHNEPQSSVPATLQLVEIAPSTNLVDLSVDEREIDLAKVDSASSGISANAAM